VGVGLAWLVHGLGARRDVEVVTVELDDEVQRTALSAPWPPWVRFESGDGAEVVGRLGQFDLIFPDAPGGRSPSCAGRWPRSAVAASSSLTTWTSHTTLMSRASGTRTLNQWVKVARPDAAGALPAQLTRAGAGFALIAPIFTANPVHEPVHESRCLRRVMAA
jgi:hypothetical protein